MPRVRLPITTDRLVLRSFRPGDEADVFAYRSVADVMRFIPGDPMESGQVEDFLAKRATVGWVDEQRPACTLAVEHEGRVVGDVLVMLGSHAGPAEVRQAQIGWVLDPSARGGGLATEAAQALLRVAFEDLGVHRVWAQLEPRNTASARICERLGMRREGVLEQASWFKGEWTDLAIYALLAAEWRAATRP